MKRPLIIGIGGAHSDIGKTTLAAALLKLMTTPASKPSRFHTLHHWGAIKYTKIASQGTIIDDPDILRQPEKDTGKLLNAGADEVLWIQSPPSGLEKLLPAALSRLAHLDGIIIEGNSAIEFSNPDIVIFLVRDLAEGVKHSAQSLLKNADIMVHPVTRKAEETIDTAAPCDRLRIDPFDSEYMEVLLRCMETIVDEKESMDKILDMLQQRAVNGTISCSSAREVASALGVSFKSIGVAANKLRIKINNCELGCF